MKAIVYEKYARPDALDLQEIEKPAVKDNEVLVKVHAATVDPLDWHFLRGALFAARIIAGCSNLDAKY